MQIARRLEKLDTVYQCGNCGAVFLFLSDVDDHEQRLGHSKVTLWPLMSEGDSSALE